MLTKSSMFLRGLACMADNKAGHFSAAFLSSFGPVTYVDDVWTHFSMTDKLLRLCVVA